MSRPVRTALLACLALALGLVAGAATAAPPPVLDRELFFGNPEIAAAQLSPDGQYVAFLKPWSDTRNIWVKKTGEPFEAARRVTAETKRPIPGFFFTRDSRLILYVKDNDGDENFNVWAVDPAAAKAEGKEVPPSRNLTDAKGARAFIYDVPEEVPGHDLRRPQRPRRRLARRLQGLDLHRQARARPQEHRPHRRLAVRPRRPAPDGGAHHRQGRHRDPEGRSRRASRRSTPAACSRPAASIASTGTASGSTWRRTRATRTSRASSSSTPRRARRSWSSPTR